MFIKILKMVGATIILMMVWYYLVRIFEMFGESAYAVGGLLSFGLIIYLWIKGYKSIFNKTVKRIETAPTEQKK